ncbi:MAG: DUF5666 domain-containing protein [Woeseiaceae bacterium]|nr:DUF5666 domain-containing protein [Woeseiaceae bacterium]
MRTKSLFLIYAGLVVLGLLSACSSSSSGGGDPSGGSAGILQIAEASYDVSEGAVVNIRVERRGGSAGLASVDFATSDETATGGRDYVRASGTLFWPDGTSGNRTISISIADDAEAEPVETFVMTLSGATEATLGQNVSTTVSILDDDTANVSAFGAITELNSVTVNGIRYETNDAAVYVNGMPAVVADLELGHTVSLNGEANFSEARGTADEISYSSTIIGPVEHISGEFGRLVVLGQTVLTDEDTVFDLGDSAGTYVDLALGTQLQISGHLNADGDILATRIARDEISTDVQLIGTVAATDLANMLFRVNRATVDYSNAVLIDLPEGMPTDGLLVTVRGSLVNGVLVVSEITSATNMAAEPGQRVHLGGMVTRFESASAFDLNGTLVRTDASTVFVNGTASDLQADAEITIDGHAGPTGDFVVASQVAFGEPIFNRTTVEYDFTDFTAVAVHGISRVTITQGAEYSVEVRASIESPGEIQASQDGDTVTLGGDHGQLLSAYVTMPVLNRIDVGADSIARVSLRDFVQPQITVSVDGVSRVHGEGLVIGDLTATVSGVSMLEFGEIRPIGSADVDISGVSQATVNMDVGSVLTGSVRTGEGTGESRLFYYGTDTSVNVATDSVSRVVRLGGTRV